MEKIPMRPMKENAGRETKNLQKRTKHIMQLVEKCPETPEEMDLIKERRKQLAELMLEYPTDSGKRAKQTSELEHTQRLYTCQKRLSGFAAIMGRPDTSNTARKAN